MPQPAQPTSAMKIPDDPEILWRALQIAAHMQGQTDLAPMVPNELMTDERGHVSGGPPSEKTRRHFFEQSERRAAHLEANMTASARVVMRSFLRLRKGGEL
jgi:hypothetical protein